MLARAEVQRPVDAVAMMATSGGGNHGGPAAEHGHHETQHDRSDQCHLGIDARDEGKRNHLRNQRLRRDDTGERFANNQI
jgi:hypothetical protein